MQSPEDAKQLSEKIQFTVFCKTYNCVFYNFSCQPEIMGLK